MEEDIQNYLLTVMFRGTVCMKKLGYIGVPIMYETSFIQTLFLIYGSMQLKLFFYQLIWYTWTNKLYLGHGPKNSSTIDGNLEFVHSQYSCILTSLVPTQFLCPTKCLIILIILTSCIIDPFLCWYLLCTW